MQQKLFVVGVSGGNGGVVAGSGKDGGDPNRVLKEARWSISPGREVSRGQGGAL